MNLILFCFAPSTTPVHQTRCDQLAPYPSRLAAKRKSLPTPLEQLPRGLAWSEFRALCPGVLNSDALALWYEYGIGSRAAYPAQPKENKAATADDGVHSAGATAGRRRVRRSAVEAVVRRLVKQTVASFARPRLSRYMGVTWDTRCGRWLAGWPGINISEHLYR
eukprot:SAG31_NODE_20182_length_581_cov_1.261411_1_plen_163_part_01